MIVGKINNNNIKINNTNKKISFGGGSFLTNVPNLHCPFCGGRIPTRQQVDNFMRNVKTYSGVPLATLIYQTFTGTSPRRIEPLVAYAHYMMVCLKGNIKFETASRLLNQERSKLTPRYFIGKLQRSLEKAKVQDANPLAKETLISNYLSGAQRLEEGGTLYTVWRNIHFGYDNDRSIKREYCRLLNITKPTLNVIEAVDIFFQQLELRNKPLSDVPVIIVRVIAPSLDHGLPSCKGGLDVEGNKLLMCNDCNRKKGSFLFGDLVRDGYTSLSNIKRYLSDIRYKIDTGELPPSKESYLHEVRDLIETQLRQA